MRHSLPNKSFRRCFVFSSYWGKISIESHKRLGIVLFWRSFTMCSVQKTHATLNQSNVKLTAKWILATRVFPRFLPIFALNSDRPLVVFTFQLIGCYDYVYFYLDLRHTLNRDAFSAVFSSNRKKNIFEISIFHEIINLRPLLFKMREFDRHTWLLTLRTVNNKRKFRITYVQHTGGRRNGETIWFSWRWHNLGIGYPLFILWGI